jgi:hypothetical protein
MMLFRGDVDKQWEYIFYFSKIPISLVHLVFRVLYFSPYSIIQYWGKFDSTNLHPNATWTRVGLGWVVQKCFHYLGVEPILVFSQNNRTWLKDITPR